MLAGAAQSAETLDAIVVDGDAETAVEAPGAVVLDRETLTHTPGTGGDPIRVLQTLPGVAVNDDASAAPAIRGSRPEDNDYFVDFLPVAYLFHFGGGVSVFNEQLVDSFTLYPSAWGAAYDGGTGAIIDVGLRDPESERFRTTLDINFLRAGALVEGPVSRDQSFYLAGRISYLDLLLKDIVVGEDSGVTFLQFPKFTDYQAKYVWRMRENATLRFQANGASDETRFNVTGQDDASRNEPDLIGQHLEDARFDSQGLTWTRRFGGGQSLRLALGRMKTARKTRAAAVLDSRSTLTSRYLKARWEAPLGSAHRLALGGTLMRARADYDIGFQDPGCTEFEVDCSVTDADRLESADALTIHTRHLFAEDTWFVSDRLSLTPGLAFFSEDFLDRRFIEPRLRGEFFWSEQWTLSAGLGRYHQFPGFLVSEKVFGNPRLDHVASTHFVAGVERRYPRGWSWKTEVYYKDFDRLVTANPATRYSNTGEGSAAGVEFLGRKDLTERFSGWLSLSMSKSRRRNRLTGESFDFEYDQPLIATLVAEYRLDDKWRFGAKWWYHSGAPDTPIIGGVPDPDRPGRFIPVYGKINSERWPAYHRLDLRADRQFGFRRADVSAYVELINAYDHFNVGGYDYNADYSQRAPVAQLPALITFGVKARF